MTTRHASLATGRSLIFEIAVTTVLFRPVSVTPVTKSYQKPRRLPCRVSTFEAIVRLTLTLEYVVVIDEIATAHEAVRLDQEPAAALLPVGPDVDHVAVAPRRERLEHG